MINIILEYNGKPKIYEKSTSEFWNDDHISKQMLKAHLNPTLEAASRTQDFIDQSVEWIDNIAKHQPNNFILDLGCGPGIYTEKLSSRKYNVTGIDFSKRSIDYAIEQSKINKSNIDYLYKNYLEIEYNNIFDLVLLIYCDFGVLSHDERKILLEKIHSAMKTNGKFIFDVFTPNNYKDKKESNTWHLTEGYGFWKPDTHLCLNSHYIYEDNIRLDQYIIVDNQNKIDVIRVWDRCYTKEMIINELEAIGFKNIEIYSDASGKVYSENSKTMCIVAEK